MKLYHFSLKKISKWNICNFFWVQQKPSQSVGSAYLCLEAGYDGVQVEPEGGSLPREGTGKPQPLAAEFPILWVLFLFYVLN